MPTLIQRAFKRDRPVFEDLLYQNIRQAGGQTGADTNAATGFMLGTGTRIVATEKIQAQGNLISTENALDMAIQGPGFFQIVQPDGTISYTRDGGFKLSQEGELVTPSGLLLQPQIVIPPEAASIDRCGRDCKYVNWPTEEEISSLDRFSSLALLMVPALRRRVKIFLEKPPQVVHLWFLSQVSRVLEKSLRACWRLPTLTWLRNWST